MAEIRRMNIKEFLEFGYLQEVNRQFFHPVGLALEVIFDSETDEAKLGGIWDYRDDPEGMIFADGTIDTEKAARVQTVWRDKEKVRIKGLGYIIQPIPSSDNTTKINITFEQLNKIFDDAEAKTAEYFNQQTCSLKDKEGNNTCPICYFRQQVKERLGITVQEAVTNQPVPSKKLR